MSNCGCITDAVEKLTACECPAAGLCGRHGMTKTEHWHKLCRTHPGYFDLWERKAGPGQRRIAKRQRIGLGDAVAWLLERFGITSARVSKWLGRDCGCEKRRFYLNRVTVWGWWRAA
jgi:hypothetical protein